MEKMFTGGCLCGAVRYECSAKPMMTGNCHCRDCQKSSGAPFVTAMAVPASALKISGDVKYYEIKADSGNAFSRQAWTTQANFDPRWIFIFPAPSPGIIWIPRCPSLPKCRRRPCPLRFAPVEVVVVAAVTIRAGENLRRHG